MQYGKVVNFDMELAHTLSSISNECKSHKISSVICMSISMSQQQQHQSCTLHHIRSPSRPPFYNSYQFPLHVHVHKYKHGMHPNTNHHAKQQFSTHTHPTVTRTRTHRKVIDPTARRPNRVCDPYGQNGKPLSHLDASNYLPTLDQGWTLVTETETATPTSPVNDGKETPEAEEQTAKNPTPTPTPTAVQKEFYHANYMDGSRFLSIVAAVAHNNNHYPKITLERRLMKQEMSRSIN